MSHLWEIPPESMLVTCQSHGTMNLRNTSVCWGKSTNMCHPSWYLEGLGPKHLRSYGLWPNMFRPYICGRFHCWCDLYQYGQNPFGWKGFGRNPAALYKCQKSIFGYHFHCSGYEILGERLRCFGCNRLAVLFFLSF